MLKKDVDDDDDDACSLFQGPSKARKIKDSSFSITFYFLTTFLTIASNPKSTFKKLSLI